MHETLRQRILRRLETLPEAQLYQVLDYIEFLESKHGAPAPVDASGLQKLAERLEDGLRKRTFSPTTVREAFQLISVADRVLSSVSEAGREILQDLQEESGSVRAEPSRQEPASAPASAPEAVPEPVQEVHPSEPSDDPGKRSARSEPRA